MCQTRKKRLLTLETVRSWLLAAALLACGQALAEEGAPLTAENLSEQTVNVPADLPPSAILLVGFSRDANPEVQPWWEALQAARAERDITPYSVTVIDGAPSFMQGMIRKGISERAADSRRDYILLVMEDAAAWRAFVGATDDATAHVVRLDEDGGICVRRTGPLTDDALLDIVAGDCETGP